MRKSKEQIVEFDAERVRPMPDQPRKRFKGIKELAASIVEAGQMSPGIVTMISGVGQFDAMLIDGERRLRACRLAGVPFRAIVREAADCEEEFVASFAANFGKQDHDVIEIAEGLARMMRGGKTTAQLARITGKSDTWVSTHLNLLKLHPDVRAMMVSDDDDSPPLTFQLAQLLVPLPPAEQVSIAKRITKGDGMKMSAARRMILKLRSDAGDDQAYRGERGRGRSIMTIESFLEEITNKIGVYIDMPGVEFNRLADSIDNRSKRTLVKAIEDVSGTLIDLAEAIENRITKPSNKIGQLAAS